MATDASSAQSDPRVTQARDAIVDAVRRLDTGAPRWEIASRLRTFLDATTQGWMCACERCNYEWTALLDLGADIDTADVACPECHSPEFLAIRMARQ